MKATYWALHTNWTVQLSSLCVEYKTILSRKKPCMDPSDGAGANLNQATQKHDPHPPNQLPPQADDRIDETKNLLRLAMKTSLQAFEQRKRPSIFFKRL